MDTLKLKQVDRFGDKNRVNSIILAPQFSIFFEKFDHPFSDAFIFCYISCESRFRCFDGYKLYQK